MGLFGFLGYYLNYGAQRRAARERIRGAQQARTQNYQQQTIEQERFNEGRQQLASRGVFFSPSSQGSLNEKHAFAQQRLQYQEGEINRRLKEARRAHRMMGWDFGLHLAGDIFSLAAAPFTGGASLKGLDQGGGADGGQSSEDATASQY